MATIERKKNGSVRITAFAGYSVSGKQIRHNTTITASELAGLTEKQREKEIDRRKMLFEERVRNGQYLDGERITFAEFVDMWLRDYAEKKLAPSTLNPYKFRLESRIIPSLGHHKLAKLQPNHLLTFYNSLSEAGARLDTLYMPTELLLTRLAEGVNTKAMEANTGLYRKIISRIKAGKGVYKETALKLCGYFNIPLDNAFTASGKDEVLSGKTIRHHHTLISSILASAVEWNIIQSNPAERVEPPEAPKTKFIVKENYYDDEQVLSLFVALENEPIKYKVIIYLTIDTGLRLSEVAGAEWSDIDFKSKQLDITRQRQYVSGYGTFNADPKSDSGIRKITISDMVVDMLREYQTYQKIMRLQHGSLWHESNNVFIHEDGKPIFPNRPSIWFSEFLVRKNLPKITFHGLRHTNASLLIAEGIDIVTLSGRLGHADKNMTLKTYSHIIKSKEKQAANRMDQFYSRVLGEK